MEQTECLAFPNSVGSFSPETLSRSSTDTVSFSSYSENDDDNLMMMVPTLPTSVPTKEKASELLSLKVSYPDNEIWKQTQQYADDEPNSEPPESEPQELLASRVNFTADQTAVLENKFRLCKYLQKPRRIKLAKELSMDERKILIWFQNRRVRERRMYRRSQFNNNHNICPSPPLIQAGWPTVSPFSVPLTASAEPVPRVPYWYQDFHPSTQFNIRHNIPPSDKNENDSNSSILSRPLMHAGACLPTVGPYQDFHPSTQFNTRHNIPPSDKNENDSNSSFLSRPIMHAGACLPTVGPYQDFHPSSPFNINHHISQSETNKENHPDSSIVSRPLINAGWPRVSPVPAPSTTSAEPVWPIPRVPDCYQDFHPSRQFNIKHNIPQSEPNEQNNSESSIVSPPLINGGWPTVSSFPAPLQTFAEPFSRVPDRYQDFYPSAYPNFNHGPPNNWRDGFYGHGQYWPNDPRYNNMG